MGGGARVAAWVAATGATLGTGAALTVAVWPRAALTPGDAVVLAALSALLHALVGAAAGGLGWLLATPREPEDRAAAAFGIGALLLLSASFLPLAAERDPTQAAVLWVAVPLSALALWTNARALAPRLALGWRPPVGWLTLHAVATPLVAAVGVAVVATPFEPGDAVRDGQADRKSTLLVTVEGLGPEADLPAIGEVRATFRQAVAPSGEVLASVATVLTGHGPPWHGAWGGGQAARVGRQTLATRAQEDGYATGAFVGRPDLGLDAGLWLGFDLVDDRAGPGGVLRRVGLLHGLLWVAPSVGRWIGWRGDDEVVAAAADWLVARGAVGSLTWVHLRDPASVDRHLARLRDALASVDRLGRTQILVVGVAGAEPLRGDLTEAAIRVPLQVAWPGLDMPMVFDAQVRLVDVAPTVAVWLGRKEDEGFDGVDLTLFVVGKRNTSLPALLFDVLPDGARVIGYRDPTWKVVLPLEDGTGEAARVIGLADDPLEAQDVSRAQPEVVKQAVEILAGPRGAWTGAAPGPALPRWMTVPSGGSR